MGYIQKPIKSKHYIQGLIEEGEHEHQDFKFQISDARKIARSISAFANNDGGRLLVGVKDNGGIAGVESDEEMYMIEQAALMYCRPPQKMEFATYRIEGKTVLKVDIKRSGQRPVKAQDTDGRWKAYYRVADENILADPLHVKLWQYSKRDDGAQVVYGDRERLIVDLVAASSCGVTVDECMLQAHASRQAVEQSVIALCCMETIAFRYIESRLMLFPATTD